MHKISSWILLSDIQLDTGKKEACTLQEEELICLKVELDLILNDTGRLKLSDGEGLKGWVKSQEVSLFTPTSQPLAIWLITNWANKKD